MEEERYPKPLDFVGKVPSVDPPVYAEYPTRALALGEHLERIEQQVHGWLEFANEVVKKNGLHNADRGPDGTISDHETLEAVQEVMQRAEDQLYIVLGMTTWYQNDELRVLHSVLRLGPCPRCRVQLEFDDAMEIFCPQCDYEAPDVYP